MLKRLVAAGGNAVQEWALHVGDRRSALVAAVRTGAAREGVFAGSGVCTCACGWASSDIGRNTWSKKRVCAGAWACVRACMHTLMWADGQVVNATEDAGMRDTEEAAKVALPEP